MPKDYNQKNIELVKKIKEEKNGLQLDLLLQELRNNNEGIIHNLVHSKFKLNNKDESDEAKNVIATKVLYDCALKFDLDSNNNFSTYFQSSLINELSNYINGSHMISKYIERQIGLINEFKNDYFIKFNKEPDVKTIAKELGLKESKVKEFESYGNLLVINDEEQYSSHLDSLSIEDDLISEEQKKQLIKALNSLNDEDKELIFLYFGLEGREEHSYSELASMYNKSDETIRQRILKILLKIKNNNGV